MYVYKNLLLSVPCGDQSAANHITQKALEGNSANLSFYSVMDG
jgi:hypothetical protein